MLGLRGWALGVWDAGQRQVFHSGQTVGKGWAINPTAGQESGAD
jgi:hypothetical protein